MRPHARPGRAHGPAGVHGHSRAAVRRLQRHAVADVRAAAHGVAAHLRGQRRVPGPFPRRVNTYAARCAVLHKVFGSAAAATAQAALHHLMRHRVLSAAARIAAEADAEGRAALEDVDRSRCANTQKNVALLYGDVEPQAWCERCRSVANDALQCIASALMCLNLMPLLPPPSLELNAHLQAIRPLDACVRTLSQPGVTPSDEWVYWLVYCEL